MKMTGKYVILIFIVFLAFLSCDNEESFDKSFDCFKKESMYNANEELEQWIKQYYKNGQVVRYEEKNGYWITYKYDELGNQISLKTSNCEYKYEYDNLNNLVEMKYFSFGIFEYYISYLYTENLIINSYQITSSNDTINWSNYNYENGKISHIESKSTDEFYYYSEEVDSLIIKRKNNSVESKKYFKYFDEKLIFKSQSFYNIYSELISSLVETWEYNDELLLRKTRKESTQQNQYQYSDDRYTYNENNIKIRSESFDESDNLIGFGIFLYDSNNNLYKFESYCPENVLNGYTLIEDNCN